MIENPNLYVITGGPGAGKTAVLMELGKNGSPCLGEVARRIIQEQVASGGNALPWKDTVAYTELMLSRSVAQFHENLSVSGPSFCDRGLPDVLCYARLIALREIDRIESLCNQLRYNEKVFISPPWQDIYLTDSERKQTFAEAVAVYKVMVRVYEDLGYSLVELPKVSPMERAEFILSQTSGLNTCSPKAKKPPHHCGGL